MAYGAILRSVLVAALAVLSMNRWNRTTSLPAGGRPARVFTTVRRDSDGSPGLSAEEWRTADYGPLGAQLTELAWRGCETIRSESGVPASSAHVDPLRPHSGPFTCAPDGGRASFTGGGSTARVSRGTGHALLAQDRPASRVLIVRLSHRAVAIRCRCFPRWTDCHPRLMGVPGVAMWRRGVADRQLQVQVVRIRLRA